MHSKLQLKLKENHGRVDFT